MPIGCFAALGEYAVIETLLLTRGQCAKDAELVPLGVGEHDPGLFSLADVDVAGTEGERSFHLRGLVVGAQVDVEAVLDRLGLRDGEEEQVPSFGPEVDPADAVALPGFEGLVEQRRPELTDTLRVGAVDGGALDAETHGGIKGERARATRARALVLVSSD